MIRHEWKIKKPKSSQLRDNKKLYDYGIENPVKKLGEVIEMKIKAEKAIKLEDGKYTGKVTGVEYRDDPYDYTDVLIEESKSKLVLKCGMPSKITEDTMLGLFVSNFTGKSIEVDKEYDVEEITKDQKVEFMVMNKKTGKGSFCNILPDSVKPIK